MNIDEIKLEAFKIHDFRNCTYAGLPYSTHLNMVKEYYDKYKHHLDSTNSEDVEKAIWFHDVPEDTGGSHNDIKKIIGEKSAYYVYLVTNVYGRNRKEKLLNTLPKINTTHESIFIKLCDRLANAKFSLSEKQKNVESSMYDTYVSEHPIFKYFLYKKNMFNDMWTELDELLKYKDNNKITIVSKDIEVLINDRNSFLKLYEDSWDENNAKHTIDEPKEIDILGDEILKNIIKYKEILAVDFIVESLTHLGQAPNIMYDDNGFFAISSDGFQSVNTGDEPKDVEITSFIPKENWKKSIREALIFYLTNND